MPIKPHSCVSVQCDICGEVYGADEGTEQHYSSEAEARGYVEHSVWLITTEGRVVCEGCGKDDPEHQRHFAEQTADA